jgi:hypothetical protein
MLVVEEKQEALGMQKRAIGVVLWALFMLRFGMQTFFSTSFLLSSLELSDVQVYEPSIRALLGTASHFCEQFVPKLRT